MCLLIFNQFEYFCVISKRQRVLYTLFVFSPVSHSSLFSLIADIILQSICFLHCFMCHFLAIFYIGIIIIAPFFSSFAYMCIVYCNTVTLSHLIMREKNEGIGCCNINEEKKTTDRQKNVWRICKIEKQQTECLATNDGTDKQVTVIVAISIWLNTYQNSNCLVVSVPTSFMVGCLLQNIINDSEYQ